MSYLDNLANDEEIELYSRSVEEYRDLKMDVTRFTAGRLQMGIYGQRQEGVNMVRIKLPGGARERAQAENHCCCPGKVFAP